MARRVGAVLGLTPRELDRPDNSVKEALPDASLAGSTTEEELGSATFVSA